MAPTNEDVFKTILDGVRVLVVDDSAETRSAFEQLLSLHGATVSQAESVADAIAAIETALPDVIVANDGADLAGPVRDRQPKDARPIPVIALTASGDEEENEALTKAGCHAVLCKPFDPEKLITLVAGSVGRC